MKSWHITVGTVTRTPTIISENGQQNTPTIVASQDGVQFSVEFDNRSDYFAARDSSVEVGCIVVSKGRGKRVVGVARKLEI